MRTEAKKSFQHGFELSEQELRRIFDALNQQMERSFQGCTPNASFEVKFKNGAIANPGTLDEILALENMGSEAVLRLLIRIDDGRAQPSSSIKLEFIDVDNDFEPGYDSISYTIVGEDQNWVFITSSQLEERISRTKKFALNQFVGRRNRLLPLLVSLILSLAMLGPFLISVINTGARLTQLRRQKIDAIEVQWLNGDIKDPIEVMIALERAQLEDTLNPFYLSLLAFIIPVGFVILFVGGLYFWARYFPVYNFLWGDYVSFYERKKSVGRFILVGVILTIIIAVIANYISALIGIGR